LPAASILPHLRDVAAANERMRHARLRHRPRDDKLSERAGVLPSEVVPAREEVENPLSVS
jgi:hypothetical protein